ncbi:hypothetical protein [Streptomyces sp. NPDC058279]|uniref:hypothetical protein n=1 Tax=Streptomyces sp. NPDC058279 TaxID=3346418 RepID=UPI0036E7D098
MTTDQEAAMTPKSATTWHEQAAVSDQRLQRWRFGFGGAGWVHCGQSWDALAISPITLGLDALSALRLSPRSGYPVLADHVRGVLYVMVAPGTATSVENPPRARGLSVGHHLLVPYAEPGTPSAHWVSAPREEPPLLLRADLISSVLVRLTSATHDSTN